MEYRYHEVDRDVMILSAEGALDAGSADLFAADLARLADSGVVKLIVDCSRLTRMTSAGVGLLAMLHHKLAKRGGEVKLAGVADPVVALLRMMRLERFFDTYPDIEAARRAFRQR